MSPGATRVLIVADSSVVAATIEAALRQTPGLCIAVGHPAALARLIEEHEPAVVILASRAARVAPTLEAVADRIRVPPVIVVVDDPRAAWTSAARRAGAYAVLGHDAPAGQIRAAIEAATAGLIALHPDVFRAAARSTGGLAAEEQALTARERQILQLMADGASNRVIARRLGISTFTVKFHVASILGKLGAGSRTEAVTQGIRSGLISL